MCDVFLFFCHFPIRCSGSGVILIVSIPSLLFILFILPTHKKYRLLCYPLRSNSGWLPIRCAYFILLLLLLLLLLLNKYSQLFITTTSTLSITLTTVRNESSKLTTCPTGQVDFGKKNPEGNLQQPQLNWFEV